MTPGSPSSYRTAVADADSLLAPAGYRVTGHEFHRTTVAPFDRCRLVLDGCIDGVPAGYSLDPAGLGRPNSARLLPAHPLGRAPVAGGQVCARLPSHCVDRPPTPPRRVATPRTTNPVVAAGVDLQHHGDADAADHLVDLAVNVRLTAPPRWLAERIDATTTTLGRYPRPAAAIAAVARRHQRPAEQVLLTAGGAEAFTLLARALRPRQAVVVHPQFTEPEAALRTAGHRVERVLLDAEDGFALHPERIPGRNGSAGPRQPDQPHGGAAFRHPTAWSDRARTGRGDRRGLHRRRPR